jgi:hypothetical protein
MFISLIAGIIPGALFVYRYSPSLSFPIIIGMMLMEIFPYCVVSMVEDVSGVRVFLGFVILYSLYEIGYLHNDFSARHEKAGASFRHHITDLNLSIFLLSRLFSILAVFNFINSSMGNYETPMLLSSLLLLLFLIHNIVKNSNFRVCTFLMLNTLKIILRLYIIGSNCILYIFSSMPHIFIKLLHYLKSKKIISGLSDDSLRLLSFPIYSSFFLIYLIVDYKLFLVAFPFFLNHNKFYIYYIFKLLIAKHFGK